jgi:hypothetical protein
MKGDEKAFDGIQRNRSVKKMEDLCLIEDLIENRYKSIMYRQ